MDGGVGESSSVGEKPVIVRVKRKIGQSPLDAFWLEINERPFKRPLLDFSKLSMSNSEKKEDVKPKKVLVRHLETVTDSETTVDIIHSLFESDLDEQSGRKGKLEERKIAFKKDNRKEQLLTKAVQQQQTAAQNARFKQIWRSRKGSIEDIHDQELHERCSFYDVIRVDAEERPDNAPPEVASLEDQKMLASFLPLLRECIPTAAEEIEADITTHTEEYVYDVYAVNEEMDISEDSSKHQFPLVIVEEEEEFYNGPDESDCDSDDSNAEDHPRNDYPDEISEEDSEEEDDGDEDDEEEEEKSEASDDESKDEETSERRVRMVLDDDEEEFFDGYAEEDANVYGDSDDEEFEDIKWSYR